jgi:hypothetical protein
MENNYPVNLLINGRPKLSNDYFDDNHKLYHSYKKDDLDDNGKIKEETIRFPDFSCNWSLFSKPKDILFRENGHKADGCYSITVLVSRFNKIATPVHDPINKDDFQNYAHVEVRLLKKDEDTHFEPPKNRKINGEFYKSLKREYRRNIRRLYEVEFEPTE